MNLKDKRVLIFGGSGLLGQPLQELLLKDGVKFWAPRSTEVNVLNKEEIISAFDKYNPEVVFNLFVSFGGIVANARHPGSIFYDNLIGNVNIIDVCKKYKVEKLIQIGTQCSYADDAEPPFKEENLWKGYPTENNAPYGIAKRVLHTMLKAYREEFGLNGIYLIPSNMYGPYDNFHPEHTHVIPALIRRFVDAKESGVTSVEIWGTGKATREFLYNYDCARAVIMAAENYDKADPVNIGSSKEVTIIELARTIADIIGYTGEIIPNNNGLDGQSRRLNSIDKAREEFRFEPRTNLREGLEAAIKYYLSNRNNLRETKIYE